MIQSKSSDSVARLHQCPVCHQPQTKLQRVLTAKSNGSTIYVCARVGECAVGVNLTKVDTWVAV
jgi:hypothetical protein